MSEDILYDDRPLEDRLLFYVENNQIEELVNLATEYPNILNEIIYIPRRNILQKAFYYFPDKISEEMINKLIELGIDIYYNNDANLHMETLHFAVLTLNPRFLKIICSHIIKDNANKIDALTDDKDTALNFLMKRQKDEHPDFINCVNVLIEAGIDINLPNIDDYTPIYYAVKKENRELVNILLKQPNIYIEKVRNLILEKGLNDMDLPEVTTNNLHVEMQCMKHLELKRETDFINTCINNSVDVNYDDGLQNFMQAACHNGLIDVIKFLIVKDVDVNKVGSKELKEPLLIVAIEGYYEIFEILLSGEMKDKVIIPKDLLSQLLLRIDRPVEDRRNHRKCLEILWNSEKKLDINYPSDEGYTPLHYASMYANSDTVLTLLERGACLTTKNIYNFMPVDLIDAVVLRKYLNTCVEQHKFTKECKVSYDYSFILNKQQPNMKKSADVDSCSLLSNHNEEFDVEKGDVTYPTEENSELTDVITYLLKNKEKRSLLKHPVLSSFVYIKWHKLRHFFYMNLLFYSIFCISLYSYIALDYVQQNNDNFTEALQILHTISSLALHITSVILVLREIFQIIIFSRTYIRNLENHMELSLIIGIIILLSSSNNSIRIQVSALIILLSAFELIMLIGQMPVLTTNIVMLRKVSWNFFKCLSWSAILIVAFSFSFFMLFNNSSDKITNNCVNGTVKDNFAASSSSLLKTKEDDEEQNDLFVHPGTSLFKTIVMLTGEFDSNSLKFCNYPYTSRIVFVMFVFVIAIVLINLLNGLALSDIQAIEQDAELHGIIARANYVNYVEKIMLNNTLPDMLGKILKSLSRKLMLFSNFEKNKLTVNLSKSGAVQINDDIECYLDENTVNETRKILENKRQKDCDKIQENERNQIINDIIKEQKVIKNLIIELQKKFDKNQTLLTT